ncbi:MAG: lamin tail domain-containing protein [Candidatus Gottesmanbacteria bacterium]|nr:lamin tail domain-containing protein [Candidatus Gottesmanbacteria bacterium]
MVRLPRICGYALLFVGIGFFVRPVNASIVINEFSSASNPEWVELYNPDDQAFPLAGVVLFFDGNSATTQKLTFCPQDELGAKSFKLITRSKNSYWLADSGDTLILKKEDDTIDSISYGSGQLLKTLTASQSGIRVPDGSINWSVTDAPSPQGDAASFVCPTPTPTPEPTNTPTPTPEPTEPPTPTPTRTLTPTRTPTPTRASTPTVKPTIVASASAALSSASAVLGATDSAATASVMASRDTRPSAKPLIISLLLVGIGCAILSLVFVWQKRNALKPPES